MELVVLGLGSNVGNRYLNIKKAIKEISLSGDFNLIAASSLYETEPWGFINQRKFINCVIAGLTKTTPQKFLKLCKQTEKSIGRIKRKRWREREIDIDILFFGNRKLKIKNLVIPHPEIKKREFVLRGLRELNIKF